MTEQKDRLKLVKSNGDNKIEVDVEGHEKFSVPTTEVKDVGGYKPNDDDHGRLWLDLYKGNIRHVPNYVADSAGVYILWDGNRWHVDIFGTLARHLFRLVCERLEDEGTKLAMQAANATGEKREALKDQSDKLLIRALRLGNNSKANSALEAARSFPGITVPFEELDADPYLYGVGNGLIRFHTKAEREAGAASFDWVENQRDMLVTKNTHVPYIPLKEQKHHPDPKIRRGYREFGRYMKRFVKSHVTEQTWVYSPKLFGYTGVLGITSFKKAIFLFGDTDTGKSTFQAIYLAAVGDYGKDSEPKILRDSQFKGQLLEALAARVVFIDEIGRAEITAELFKNVTGGRPISGELKHKNASFTILPRSVIISACNSPPNVPDEDEALRNRIISVPFRHRVYEDAKDEDNRKDSNAIKDLPEICKTAMLAWLIEGCMDAIMDGGIYPVPDELVMETKEFVSRLSDISMFVEDTLYKAAPEDWDKYALQNEVMSGKPKWPNNKCLGDQQAWTAFTSWQYENVPDRESISKNQFTRKMKGQGFIQDGSKMGTQKRWIGVTLKAGPDSSVSKMSGNELECDG